MAYSTNQHAEWLSLIEISGPFLAEPILNLAFPQGLEKVDPVKKKQFRQTYDEWREVIDSDAQNDIAIKDKIHQQWTNWVLKFGLELDEDEDGDILKTQSQMQASIQVVVPEHNITIKPEFAVIKNDDTPPYMLVQTYPAGTALREILKGDGWSTSPAERMAHLCRGVGTRLGLITNGEQWMFIDAPAGGITTYASWFARLWGLEPVTLKAFYSLFNIGIVFNGFDEAKTLPQLIDHSLEHQDDVTQTLGTQVSRAVEVLIQSIDRINHDHNGELLAGVEPEELYEAGLTLMMRLVFLLCAEERGLLLLGDQAYEANYALSTLRAKLREEASLHGEEVLSYRKNAWARLLAIFRAVYAGVEHENMRMPALGGSLFDPDRFPFLEGRIKGSRWLEEDAKPLPIDNRTVLLFLDAIQLYKGRTLSYRALDVEQIGYVYEGLLEQTVKRAPDVTLELSGSKSCKKPWVQLGELASASLDGDAALKALLKERTASSASRITNDLAKEVTDADVDKLLVACYNDAELCQRIKPYYHFLRFDAWGNPLLYPKDAYMLTNGSDRRETGSHYTPKSLTESIVTETLEPVVYIGPAEGNPREEWQLKSPEALLELKICDPAMGSGAFLVQVCRWLAERVCESWLIAEKSGAFVTVHGITIPDDTQELIPVDAEERLILAKRLISERCLYGVDINPLAVELAKLSIWLVTLSKDRPFGFLDHNLKSGDSLLGIHSLDQLCYLNLNQSQVKKSKLVEQPFTKQIKELVADALELRKQIASHDINLVSDINEMALLEEHAREKILLPKLIADAFIGLTLESGGKLKDISALSSFIQQAVAGDDQSIDALKEIARRGLSTDLPERNKARKALHWVLEFPEVLNSSSAGFDAVVGNPPFLGNKYWRKTFGNKFQIQMEMVLGHATGKVDLSLIFNRRSLDIIPEGASYGLISASNISEGSSIPSGLGHIVEYGDIYKSQKGIKWPGSAAVIISIIHFYKGKWLGKKYSDGVQCDWISPRLISGSKNTWSPMPLQKAIFSYAGVDNSKGDSLIFTEDSDFYEILKSEKNTLIRPYVTGDDITSSALNNVKRYSLEILDLSLEEIKLGWPITYDYLIENVQHNRTQGQLKSYGKAADRWWQFVRNRAKLTRVLQKHECCLAYSKNTKYPVCIKASSSWIYTNKVILVSYSRVDLLPIALSSIFQLWLKKFSGGSLGVTLSLSISESFDKFPLPDNSVSENGMKVADELDTLIKKVAKDNNIGLTGVYNKIDDYLEIGVFIRLRHMLIEVTKEVLKAYGWEDIELDMDFRISENDKNKFVPDSDSQEILFHRLLELNKQKYESV
jgi:hypothetical protein